MFALSLLYLAFTIIRPQDYVPGMAGLPIMSALLVLAFLSWLGSAEKNFAAPQFLLLPAFLLVAMASQVVNGWGGGVLYVLSQLGPSVIIFFVLTTAINSPRRVAITFGVISVSAMVLALHSAQQAAHGIGWTGMTLGEDGRIRYVGIFNDPNDIGLLFVMALPMAAYLSAHAGFFGRWFWRAGVALLLWGVYLTQSRGTQLAVLVMGAVFLWRRRGAVTALVLSAGGLIGLMLLPSSRMTELDASEESALGRVDAWYEGLDMFKTHPLFGVGAGNFTDYNELTAHNSFVLVLAETGFLGFVTWLAFVGYGFWMMTTLLNHQPEWSPGQGEASEWPAELALSLTLLCALSGFFAAAFFLSRSYNIMLYTLAAIVVAQYMGARQRHPTLPLFSLSTSGLRWLPIAIAAIMGLFLTVAVLLRGS